MIDDGGHLPEQQVVTIEWLLPRIAPGGLYMCEDIMGPFQRFHAFVDGFTRPLNNAGDAPGMYPANSLQQQIASVHRYPLLTVIEKTTWNAGALESRLYGTEWPAQWTRASVSHNDTPR